MGSNGVLKIKQEDLDEILNHKAKSLVGKVCKRFEILENKNDIKSNVKELIYEEIRNIGELIYATNYGLGLTTFNFTKGKDTSKP